MNPKVSYVMITARQDFPYLNRDDLHVFETTGHCMRQQTFTDFEWIVVDAKYHERKDYFTREDWPFQIKHIPAQPNVWLDHGLPGVCTQYNKGIVYADGQIIFFTGDSYMFLDGFMELMWSAFLKGYFSLAWYMFDNTFADKLHRTRGDRDTSQSPVPYEILGYKGLHCGLEHRYLRLFRRKGRPVWVVPWRYWFGCSSASLDAMLEINGFDQRFDGDKMLMDMDVGNRLQLAGYGNNFMMMQKFFLIRPTLKESTYKLGTYEDGVTFKCSKGLMGHSRFFKQYRANTKPMTVEDVQWIKQFYCGQGCDYRKRCAVDHPWQYPFEHKKHRDHQKWFKFWLDHIETVDLEEERELRLEGDKKYQEGTFIG